VIETGCGFPWSPGELASITGGIAASDDRLQLGLVIAVAAAGAIVGDNIGYVIGRTGGRRLLEHPRGPFARQRKRVLAVADPFFDKHGPKAVFLGRWLPVLRVYASWMAGGSKMRWGVFFFWNAAGGICWATSMVLAGYFGGSAAKTLVTDFGKYGIMAVALGLITLFLVVRIRHRRTMRGLTAQPQLDDRRPEPAEPPA
jgi:membrane protein DedA with SNARE-associated domain